MDQLAIGNSVCWYGHVLSREDDHIMRMALDLLFEGQRRKGRPERMWKRQVEEESVKVDFRREDVLYR